MVGCSIEEKEEEMKASEHAAERFIQRVTQSKLGVLPPYGNFTIKRDTYRIYARYGLVAGEVNYFVRVSDPDNTHHVTIGKTTTTDDLFAKIEDDIATCMGILKMDNTYKNRRNR